MAQTGPATARGATFRRRLLVAFGLCFLVAAGLFGQGLVNARADPIVRRGDVALPDWPKNEPPIRVALLSDIHIGNWVMDPARLGRIVAQTNSLKPDLVVLAGDFVVGHNASGADTRAAQLTAPLVNLNPRLGVVAVLGNHDHWTSPGAVVAALSHAKITVLENGATPRGPIVVAGVGDAFSGHDRAVETIEGARRYARPIVVLTHSPDLARQLPRDVHLELAGHTHCGQVMLPWGLRLPAWSPYMRGKRLFDPRYLCGVVHDPGREVVITAGLGSGTAPIRFGAPPDLWLLTLGPDQGRPAP